MTKKVNKVNKEVATNNLFARTMDSTRADQASAEKEVSRLEEQLRIAKDNQSRISGEVRRLKRIDALSTCTANLPYEWNIDKYDASSYGKYAWKEVHRYRTAVYEFTAVITERTDLKKFKWEISFSGNKESYRYKDSYTDRSYVKNKAEEWKLILEEKFASEAAAREALETRKEQLVSIHIDEINVEQNLIKYAKVRPRIEVGSIVEHGYWGRGKVAEHYADSRWYVLFDRSVEHLGDKAKTQVCDEDNLKLIAE